MAGDVCTGLEKTEVDTKKSIKMVMIRRKICFFLKPYTPELIFVQKSKKLNYLLPIISMAEAIGSGERKKEDPHTKISVPALRTS